MSRVRANVVIIAALVFASLIVFAPLSRGDDRGAVATPSLALEVRVERGEVLSRVIVSIRNRGEEPYAFETGARGGSGSLDDGYRVTPDGTGSLHGLAIVGTRRTVVPEVIFKTDDGRIQLKPPLLSGPADRRMMPHKQKIAPKEVLDYASFAVPTFYIEGAFSGARLELPSGPLTVRKLTVPAAEETAG